MDKDPTPKPFYRSLYFQVITAIVIGVLLGHFSPATGEAMKPVENEDDGGVYATEIGTGGPVRFIPSFVLESHDLMADGQPIDKAYLDRLIPAADAARIRMPLRTCSTGMPPTRAPPTPRSRLARPAIARS